MTDMPRPTDGDPVTAPLAQEPDARADQHPQGQSALMDADLLGRHAVAAIVYLADGLRITLSAATLRSALAWQAQDHADDGQLPVAALSLLAQDAGLVLTPFDLRGPVGGRARGGHPQHAPDPRRRGAGVFAVRG